MGLGKTIIYLDACLVIYLVEKHEVFCAQVEQMVADWADFTFAISDLTKMECLILPFRNADQALVDRYRAWFNEACLISLGSAVFEKAARLRAEHSSLKTADALHLAAALHDNCDQFWTNDDRLARIAPTIIRNIVTK